MMTNECGCPYGNCDCEVVTMEKHVCDYQPSKRGNFVACKCGERFPCADKDCGHKPCWDERGKLPLCHWCRGQLSGPNNTEEATWGSMNVRNHTRAGHYCCRDAYEKTPRREIAARAKGKNAYYPEVCTHTFEGKDQLTVEQAKILAGSYSAE